MVTTSLMLTLKDWSRFWSKVDKTSPTGCWYWTSEIGRSGYGYFSLCLRPHLVHRVAFISTGGLIPKGKELDHLCRHRACCNPAHLEPVTRKENCLRGEAGELRPRKTHCIRGHLLADDNLIPNRGSWVCRECARMHKRAWKEKHPERDKENYWDNRKRKLQYAHEYYWKNREKILERLRANNA